MHRTAFATTAGRRSPLGWCSNVSPEVIMIPRYAVTTVFLAVAACATSSPEVPESIASAEAPVTNSDPATGDVDVAEIPEVPKVTDIPVRDEVVCRMEKRTGTNRAVKVCRSRSNISRGATEAKETFEVLRRSQVEYP
jgi:hypothetical protein